ncbi:MAG: 5-methyltetrahydropteroyltriglutamate--homocysteine S-methyltransferase, partial [Pirellulales bacterium]|nr:5-methyltetrahydropteroyltriglutamate--homocysteine S-methyltransferase [Pirellulales bacterium]
MPIASNLGFPRVGPNRELKRTLEQFWAGKIDEKELQRRAAGLRKQHWQWQKDAGLEHIPSNDFTLYDHVLDTSFIVGAIPSRFRDLHEYSNLDLYFAMARGAQICSCGIECDEKESLAALEMTKWFDTNYHYLVPEFEPDQQFILGSTKPLDEFAEAKALGIHTRPVLLGPVSFLLLGKSLTADGDTLDHLDAILPVYEKLLKLLNNEGADWVQIDEPCLVTDLTATQQNAMTKAYQRLSTASGLKILIATYFGDLGNNFDMALGLPVDALHVDLVRGRDQLDRLLESLPQEMYLSLGLINGRNLWKTDLEDAVALARRAVDALGPDRILIGPSCSLLHVPVDLELETDLDEELKSWMAFARQKLHEINILTQAVGDQADIVQDDLAANARDIECRRGSIRTHNPAV